MKYIVVRIEKAYEQQGHLATSCFEYCGHFPRVWEAKDYITDKKKELDKFIILQGLLPEDVNEIAFA